MSSDSISKYLARPATAFVIGAVGTNMLSTNSKVGLMIGGVWVPVWVFGGLAAAAGVELGQVATDYIAPHITDMTLYSAPAHSLLNVALGAGGTALAYQLATGGGWSDEMGITSILAVAAAAEVGSGYATEMLWKPMLQQYY